MVLQLAQEHRLDLEQPVQRYLPGLLPADYPQIPVYTLLDHTSGLPSVDIPGLYDPEWILRHRFEHWSPREVVDTALWHPIDFQPGTAQKYTNTAYVTAGMIIEKVTGRSYASNLRDRITDPLNLRHTYRHTPEVDGRACPQFRGAVSPLAGSTAAGGSAKAWGWPVMVARAVATSRSLA